MSSDKSTWSGPEWNAYVESGETREERARRLAEVPEHMRAGVESHVRTVFAIRAHHRRARGKGRSMKDRLGQGRA